MPEPAQIDKLGERSVFRLKSAMPEHVAGGEPASFAGQELPSRVGDTLSGRTRILCLGPADWLLVSQMHFATEVSAQGLALVELTDGVAGLAVTGSAVRELLAKGCGLDLHPRSFPAGRCARTRFAQIPLVMDCLEASRFELYAARSYEHYLHAWLDDAAREFAVG